MCTPPSTTALTNALELQRPVIDSTLQSILPPKKLIIWLKVNNTQEMTPSTPLQHVVPFKIRVLAVFSVRVERESDFSAM